jgi:hypothetical protein
MGLTGARRGSDKRLARSGGHGPAKRCQSRPQSRPQSHPTSHRATISQTRGFLPNIPVNGLRKSGASPAIGGHTHPCLAHALFLDGFPKGAPTFSPHANPGPPFTPHPINHARVDRILHCLLQHALLLGTLFFGCWCSSNKNKYTSPPSFTTVSLLTRLLLRLIDHEPSFFFIVWSSSRHTTGTRSSC